ncbi:hypothetical protein BOX37_01855 [Nocardia mangyaensis]|uniref:DUF6779 domain-containing protein n=1 Tax=Nocardia mangyaensis TaxID=2213200 RepID=A0A1J0VLM9_9NOCA|nr:DUF6779 domain-containing protein [Nocardia mangyaensis]APE32918.1 hypothetical protein BOX37_01855 [Nocardia mangyaensis]
MVSPSRSTTPRRRRDDAGKLFVGLIIALGLTASVFLVFSDNLHYVRIGLVAALWAAVLGALAATRYRKDAAVDNAKVRDLQTVYELQLEREINARREYEMGVEARVRAEVGADATEIAALRAELTLLRQNLQVLFDGALPDERPALQADAFRIDALPSGGFDAFDEPERDFDDSPEDATAAWFGPWQQPPSALKPVFMQPVSANFADPYDDPVTAETSAVQLDEYAETQESEPAPEPAPAKSSKTPPPRLSAPHTRQVSDTGLPVDPSSTSGNGSPTESPAEPAAQPSTPVETAANVPAAAASSNPPSAPAGDTPAVPAADAPAANAVTEPEQPVADKPVPAKPAPAPAVGTSSRRRRRAESEDSPRLSVADIMANLQSESRS